MHNVAELTTKVASGTMIKKQAIVCPPIYVLELHCWFNPLLCPLTFSIVGYPKLLLPPRHAPLHPTVVKRGREWKEDRGGIIY